MDSLNRDIKKQICPGRYSEAKKIIPWLGLMILIIFLTYSNHFHNDFHFDDTFVIQENPYIRDLANIPLFFSDASTINSSIPVNQLYRPMLVTSLALDYWIAGGLNPFWFHVSTFVWFILQCILMYFFFLKICNRSTSSPWNPYFSLFAVAWYGLHTANAETINYITARSDSLSTFWMMVAFMVFMQWPGLRKWGLYFIPFIIAVLFKEPVIVFPVLLFLYVLYFEERCGLETVFKYPFSTKVKQALKTTLPACMVSILMALLIISMISPSMSPGGPSVYLYMITQPFVIFHYFQTFFLPISLSADSDWTLLTSAFDWRFIVGLIFIIGLFIIAFVTSKNKKYRPISFGILWFFIALAPTSSIIPLDDVLNDHRTFFPYIGLVLAVSYSIYLLFQRIARVQETLYLQILFISSLCLLLGAYAYGTYQRNIVWKTSESLWLDASLKSPKNARAFESLGVAQLQKGDYGSAEHSLLKALKLQNPRRQSPILYTNIGALKAAQGKVDEAIANFKKETELDMRVAAPRGIYASYLISLNQWLLAEEELLRALKLFPNDLHSRYLLMAVYFHSHDEEHLKQLADDTLRLSPNDKQSRAYLAYMNQAKQLLDRCDKLLTPECYFDLSQFYYQNKDYIGSIHSSLEAIKLKPDYSQAHNNICAAYNASNYFDEAETACLKALKINSEDPLALSNLEEARQGKKGLTLQNSQRPPFFVYIDRATLEASQGKVDEAIADYKKGIQLEPRFAFPRYVYAGYLIRLNQWMLAEKELLQALKLFTKDLNSQYLLMAVYYHNHDEKKLKQLADEILALDADNMPARVYLDYIKQMAQLLERCDKSLTPECYLDLCQQYYQHHDYFGSIGTCLKAVHLKPDYFQAYNNICAAYNALNQFGAAETACLNALKINPKDPLATHNLEEARQGKRKEEARHGKL